MTNSPPQDEVAPEAALAAHDLRNLLSTVLGHAELQLRILDDGGGQPEALRESLEAMQLAATRASTLCEAMLAHDDADRVEPLDLGEMARVAGELLMTRSGGAVELRLAGEEGIQVHGQHDAIERALLNLMWNAVDAQSSNPSQELRLEWGQDTTGPWLEVADRGPGLPGGKLGDLERAGRSTRGGGRGLGLAGVARTMRRHGGRLRGRDRDGGGAVLRLEFGLERELDFDAATQDA